MLQYVTERIKHVGPLLLKKQHNDSITFQFKATLQFDLSLIENISNVYETIIRLTENTRLSKYLNLNIFITIPLRKGILLCV